MLFHDSLLSSSIPLFLVVFCFLIYQQSRSDDNCKSDADAEETSPRSIITERSVDIAYASYITKISDSGTVTPSTVEESKLTDNSDSASVDITDTSNTKIQKNAIQPVSRCSTLRAAAAPFQPAALDARSRGKDRTGLSLSQSNRDQDSDRNNAQEVVLLGSTVRAAPTPAPVPVPIATLPAAVTVAVPAVLKEVVHSRVISADAALSLPGGVTSVHGVHGIHAQRIAPRSTVPAATTAAAPLQLMSRQKLNSVSTSLNLSSSTSSQKSTGSKAKLSHSTVNSSTVNAATASASTELWHKKESNKAFFYESEKSENSRINGNHERRYSSGSNRGNGNGGEDWDAAMEAEVTEASEHVWRQVEKWIEAEAMAEEAAWNVLVLGHDNEDEERYLGEESDCTEEDFSGKPPDTEVESVLSPLELTSEQSNEHNQHRVQHGTDHALSLNDNNSNSHNSNNSNSSSSSSAMPTESHRSRISAFSTDKLLSNNISSSSSAAVSTTHTPSTTTMTPSMYSCSTVTYESPRSSSPAADWNISGANKCLHAKLSAPDRRRAVSPTEVRRKQEAKQHSAESNRDRTVAERRQRALLVSDRAKIRGINEQKRLNLAESALEERLRDAEKRHEECIKVIKLRAGNENTKVSEVMFINNMNAEGIVDQLRQKLVEVEARVLAAVMRRQDILTGITARQRKRNNRKVQQMSELRLQLERQKMERWDKLQRRLEAVQVRRQARFQEMQRRSDAQELTRARLATTYYLSKERDRESLDFNSVKSFGVSLSSMASTINSFKAQLTSPLSNSGTLDLGNSTLISAAVEAATTSEKSKDKQKRKQKDRDKEKEKEKEKERFASAVVTALSAASPVSIPASVPVPFTTSHSLPLPGPLPLPASLPASLTTSVLGSAYLPLSVPTPGPAAAANPLRSRISNSSSNNSSISPSASASASDSAMKTTAPTLTPTSSSMPLKVTDTVSRVKSKHGIKAAVVPSRPVRSSSRPFITSLKSPSVSGCAGFFESSSAKVTVIGKSSAVIMRSNSGSSGNNNNNNSSSSNSNNNSNCNNSNISGIDVSTADSVKGTVLNLNRSHKPITALSTKIQHEVRTCEYNELSELDAPSLTLTELLHPHTTEEKFMNKSKRSNSVCDGDVEIINTETEMTSLTGAGAGVQGSVIKKKKKGKKKDKGVEKDEEMTLLDSLLHAKEQLKDSEMKNTVCTTTGVSNDVNNKNIITVLGVVHMITDVTSRPRLFKHLNTFAKALKKKQGLQLCRDQSTGHFSGLYDVYLTLTKLNFKNHDSGSSENKNENENENINRNKNGNENNRDVNVHYNPASTVHNLVTYMCKNIDTLLLGKVPSGKVEDYTTLKAAISFDVSVVLGKLESGLDLKKEIGLFLKRGGNVLLRILLGDEIGLLSNSGCCILGGVDDVASSGLLTRICRAVNACNLTERARESSFSAGINYMVSDLTLVFSSHLTDWLAAQQWCYISEGHSKRLILSNECQSIPLLLSALTCQLNRTASTISSPDIEPSRKTQHYTFIRYIFSSGVVSSLCRAVRSLAPLHSYASEELFIYLLLYSVLECLDALCLCVWGMEEKISTIPTTPTTQVINLTNVECTPTPTSTTTTTSTSTSQCDAKSCSVVVPFSRKDMVCTLQDMHTAPTLACMLER